MLYENICVTVFIFHVQILVTDLAAIPVSDFPLRFLNKLIVVDSHLIQGSFYGGLYCM